MLLNFATKSPVVTPGFVIQKRKELQRSIKTKEKPEISG